MDSGSPLRGVRNDSKAVNTRPAMELSPSRAAKFLRRTMSNDDVHRALK